MRSRLLRLFLVHELMTLFGLMHVVACIGTEKLLARLHCIQGRRKPRRMVRFESLEDRRTFSVDAAWFAASPPDLRAVQVGPQQLQQEYIVKLKPSTTDSVFSADRILATFGVDVIRGLGERDLVEVRSTRTADQLRAIPQVARVEANQRLKTLSDPISTWGIEKISVNTSVRNASTGTGVIVAVLDTGYQMNHPDLAGQFFVNPREVPGNGIDDDGSGFVDDVFGWDFVGKDSNPSNDVPTEVHGTHVAGTIAARTSNGIGVASVAPNAKILPLRFLDSSGRGWLADAIQGVNYTTRLRQLGSPIVAINGSFGGGGYSQAFQDAINSANSAGITFVAAAGNAGSSNDISPSYPASYANVVSVAATTSNDSLASFSNFGQSVTIAAPGQGIVSTTPNGQYAQLSGTSMAAPHVAGAIALLRSREPQLSPAQVRQRLVDSADRVGINVSSGRLNAAKLLGVNSIGTPTNLTIVNRFGTQTDVRYSSVVNATAYEVESFANGRLLGTIRTSTVNARIPSDPTQITRFRVRAIAGGEIGAWSETRDIAPRSTFTVENRWRNALDIQIAQPGNPVWFRVNFSQDAGRTWQVVQVPASQRLVRINGLRAATDVRIRVDAVFADETVGGLERTERTRS